MDILSYRLKLPPRLGVNRKQMPEESDPAGTFEAGELRPGHYVRGPAPPPPSRQPHAPPVLCSWAAPNIYGAQQGSASLASPTQKPGNAWRSTIPSDPEQDVDRAQQVASPSPWLFGTISALGCARFTSLEDLGKTYHPPLNHGSGRLGGSVG